MTDTVRNMIAVFSKTLIEKEGHAYASGYLGSLAETIAVRLSEDEQKLLVEDLAQRLANHIK